MNETMLALLGFVTIITVIVLLLKNVTVPSLAFISVATASSAVLVLTGTFSVQEMGDFIAEGVKGVHATAVFWGIVEKKRGAGDMEVTAGGNVEEQAETREYARPKLLWFNLILTLAVIACLILVKVPSYYVFMLGCAIALLVNFRGASLQNKIIKSHAGPAIMMSSTILCAGVFLGVMEKTGIMNNMATVLAGFVPMSMGRFLPLIIGVLAVPLTLMFDTDSFFFGLMPVLIEIAGNFGVLPAHIAIVMVVCRNCATFISPVVPATFLRIGLADVEIKDHIKNCFFWIWGVSIVCLLAGLVLGVIKI